MENQFVHPIKIVSRYDQDIPQPQTADESVSRNEEMANNNHETLGRQTTHSNQLSLSSSKRLQNYMEWAKSNVQQNIEQLQNPIM